MRINHSSSIKQPKSASVAKPHSSDQAKPKHPKKPQDSFDPKPVDSAKGTSSGGKTQPAWVGNLTVQLSRGGPSSPKPLAGPITYDSWVRQRADSHKISFEVWQPGVTDFDNPNLWKQLDLEAHYSTGGGPEKVEHVALDTRSGNNARYTLDLGKLDPYGPQAGPTSLRGPQNVSLYFTVNGKRLDDAGKPISVVYSTN